MSRLSGATSIRPRLRCSALSRSPRVADELRQVVGQVAMRRALQVVVVWVLRSGRHEVHQVVDCICFDSIVLVTVSAHMWSARKWSRCDSTGSGS